MGVAVVTTDVTPELAEAIQRGYDQRDRANMAPTIAYFQALLAEHPDHPVLVYEVGGAYDTAGQEETARGYYERALALGLDGDVLRRCLCQYASTLKWLGELDESLAVLDRARREFPDSHSLRVFRAPTLNDAPPPDQAGAPVAPLLTPHAAGTHPPRW